MTKKHCLWKTRKKKEEIQIHGEPGKKGATEGWILYQTAISNTHTHISNQFKNIRHITIISEKRKDQKSWGWGG